MYPAMIEQAKEEGNKLALRSFHLANEVEKVHAGFYKKALEALGKNKKVDYYICKVCGNTVEGEPPDVCPVCGAKKVAFYKVD
jgi:rubrerythrin